MEMKRIKAWLGAGIVMSVVWLVLSFGFQFLFKFSMLDLPGMRTMQDPMWMLFFAYPFLLSAVMVFAWAKLQSVFEQKHGKKGALPFAILVWLLSGLPSAFIVFTSMNYPMGFTVNSLIGSFLTILAGAVVIEKMAM
jgi:hypothetical protein